MALKYKTEAILKCALQVRIFKRGSTSYFLMLRISTSFVKAKLKFCRLWIFPSMAKYRGYLRL